MHFSNAQTAVVLSLLLAFTNACGDRDFKGSTAIRTSKPAAPATAENKPQTGDATPEANPIAKDEPSHDEFLPGEDIEIPRIIGKKPETNVNKFWSSLTTQNVFSFSLDTQAGATSFKLTDIQAAKTQAHNQITRTATTDSFKQGTAGTAIKQSFTQKASKGLVDILVVVDDSGSMVEEQNNLATKLSALLTSIRGSNWQIGVVTTSVQANDKCLMTLIKSTDVNAETKFKTAVSAGVGGNSNEAGVKQAVIGLGCSNNPWLRSNATTAVLIVSDADNCTNDGVDCGTNAWAKESYLINYVEQVLKKEFWKNFGVYGIFSLPAQRCSVSEQVGTQYQRLMNYKNTNQVHKNAGDICQTDYSTTLNQISADIALLLENQFELSDLPDSSPVTLTVDGVDVLIDDYTISGRTITFKSGREPENGKSLVVDYNTGATPRFSSVILKNDPVAETVVVKVGANVLPSSGYDLNGKNLVFKVQPADLSTIAIDYRIAKALPNAFQLEKAPLTGTLKVTVDAKAPVGMTFDAAANQIVFNPPPTDGAAINISYDYRVGPNLLYAVSSAAGSSNHKIYDGATSIPFTKSGDNYTINPGNHALGKTLVLKYDAPSEAVRFFDLPTTPVAGSVVFVKDTAACKLGNGISVSGNRLAANCTVTAKADFEMTYNSIETFDSFKVEVPNPEVGIWEVLIDGVRFEKYVREGKTIKIDYTKYLKPNQAIEIRYTGPEE